MRVHHGTSADAAAAILATGFLESTVGDWRGVWLSTWPAAAPNDDEAVLALDLPDEIIGKYEITEDGAPPSHWVPAPRTFLVPVAIVNAYSVRLLDEDELAAAFAGFTWRAE